MVDQSPLKSSFDSSFLENYNEFCKTLLTKIIDLTETHPLMCHLSQKKLIKLTKNPKWRLDFRYYEEISRFYHYL